ncbi:MAG: PTS transporter subunit IIC, partial [Peptostreptococcaceae bacterium]
ALSVGHPAVLSASLLLVPITIVLSVILPGNTTLPFGDLAAIPFLVCLMVTVFRGNIVRTIVGGTLYIITTLYVSSWASGFVTTAARAANFDLGGNSTITTLTEGGLWTTFVYMQSAQKLGFIGLGILCVIFIAGLAYVNKFKNKKVEENI